MKRSLVVLILGGSLLSAAHAETGQWPVSVTLTVVRYKQRFRFQVVMS